MSNQNLPKRAWKAKTKNMPKGEFLAMFRKTEGTWRIQMVAVGPTPEARKVIFRVQLWDHADAVGGTRPKKDGPSGFTLTPVEVKKLIAALEAGLDNINTGEFDLLDDDNALPGRSR